MDFTITSYRTLIESLQKSGYTFLPFGDYIESSNKELITTNQIIILRHDVDNLKLNSLLFAKIQNDLGIKGTYYFRIVPQSYDEQVIKEIAELGYEIGYHYEDVDLVNKERMRKGESEIGREELIDEAYESFCKNLALFRKNFDIKTICMHGSPRSKYDNKDIWKKYDYKELGIIGEPYLDIDFNEVFYLTDTGRRWDGYKVSIRDKISNQQKLWEKQGLIFHSTKDIINAIEENKLPDKIMMTFHPQRWHAKPLPWIKEIIVQNIKNVIKKYFFVRR